MFGIFRIGQTYKQQIQSDLAQILGVVTVLQGQMGNVLNSLANVGGHLKLIEQKQDKQEARLAQIDDFNAALTKLQADVAKLLSAYQAQGQTLTTLQQQVATIQAQQLDLAPATTTANDLAGQIEAALGSATTPPSTTPSTTTTEEIA